MLNHIKRNSIGEICMVGTFKYAERHKAYIMRLKPDLCNDVFRTEIKTYPSSGSILSLEPCVWIIVKGITNGSVISCCRTYLCTTKLRLYLK